MKTNYLLIFLVLSTTLGFAQIKDSLSVEEKERREKNIQAGNPFKEFGYKAKIATLSKGKYLEFHDLDSIVQVGSVMINTKTKRIVTIIEKETLPLSEATLKPEIISRWMSPDPLSEEFPDKSPYNFTNNNPVYFNDPTGLASEAPLDDYGVDKKGNIKLINRTKDDFDRLYAVDDDGNKIDTNDDGNVDTSDSQQINDKAILPSLSIKGNKDGDDNSYAFTQNSEDAFNLFNYLADNTSVEWGLNKYSNNGSGSQWFFCRHLSFA